MAIKVQFISVQTLKENSVIQANVDEKILTTAINEYQELELEDMLGCDELTRITAAVIAANGPSPVPLTPSDETLLGHIKKVMIYGALMYSIAPIKIKFSNKGLQELSDDHASKVEAQEARSNYAFKLEGYKAKLVKFLKERDAAANNSSACCQNSNVDLTFDFTGVYMPDEHFSAEDWYKNEYYKDKGHIIVR